MSRDNINLAISCIVLICIILEACSALPLVAVLVRSTIAGLLLTNIIVSSIIILRKQ